MGKSLMSCFFTRGVHVYIYCGDGLFESVLAVRPRSTATRQAVVFCFVTLLINNVDMDDCRVLFSCCFWTAHGSCYSSFLLHLNLLKFI